MLQRYRQAYFNRMGYQTPELPQLADKIDSDLSIPPPTSPIMECPICLTNPLETTLDCEHRLCKECYTRLAPGANGDWNSLPLCPLCRTPHLAVNPAMSEQEAAELINPIKAIKLPESTIAELSKASGAYLGQLIESLSSTKNRITSGINLLHGMNRHRHDGMLPQAEPTHPDIQYIATMTIVANPNFADIFGQPPYQAAYWSGSGGYRFQYMMSAPQVPDNCPEITDNVLRRNPSVSHLSDNLLAMVRFGLLPPEANELLLVSDEAVPAPVLYVSKMLSWFITHGHATNFNQQLPSTEGLLGNEVIEFYQNTDNSLWYYDTAHGRCWEQVAQLLAFCWAKHLAELMKKKGDSRVANELFHTLYTRLSDASMEQINHTFNQVVQGHFPELRSPKRCPGCTRTSPLISFYSARRGNEPRRVRCEGCYPRATWLREWGGA